MSDALGLLLIVGSYVIIALFWVHLRSDQKKETPTVIYTILGKLEEIQRQLSDITRAKEKAVTELDIDGVLDAIRANGFLPEINEEGDISFDVQEDVFHIFATELPMFQMAQSYTINPESNFDSIVDAAHLISEGTMMVKILTYNIQEHRLVFQIESLENNYEHLKSCLIYYIDILRKSSMKMMQEYDRLRKEKEVPEAPDYNNLLAAMPDSNKWMS